MWNRRNSKPLGFAIADALVFQKVRKALGLDRALLLLSGAAPMAADVVDYFSSLNMPVLEAYGMSESSGPHSMNTPTAFRLGSIGKALSGCATKIVHADKDGNGEVSLSLSLSLLA